MAAEAKKYMDALSEYLQTEEWQASIDMFVAENCGTFKSAKEFTHDHHKLWKSYHEIVEMILDNMALESVGGNVATLEKALEKIVDRPVKGPRDAATRDVLERLMTYTNFEHFSHMMNRACLQRPEGEERPRSTAKLAKHRDSLVTLGFSPDMVSQLLSERAVSGDGDETLEDLVMALSAMESQPKTGTRSSSNTGSHNNHTPSKHKAENKDKALDLALNAQSFRSAASPTPAKLQFLQNFIDDGPNGGLQENVSELFAKFTMARSVLETFHDATGTNTSDDILVLLDWASDMLALHADILACYHQQQRFATFPSQHEDAISLYAWFEELEKTRRKADDDKIAGHMLSDTEMQRMAELDRIAAMGTEDERLLHSLISRNDTVTRDVEALTRKCTLMFNSARRNADGTTVVGLKRESLEELYLYLKEKVASGDDLGVIADEMHEIVYSQLPSDKGKEVPSHPNPDPTFTLSLCPRLILSLS